MPNDERCDECQQPATPEPMQADSSEHLRVVASLGDALRRLSFAAQTTGGTTGPDAELQSAIGQAEQALSLGGIWQAMSATTEPVEDGIRNAEDELNCAEEVLDAITCEFSDGEFPVTDFNCIGDYITAVVDVFKERLAAQQPATTEPVASRNPFASRCYAMSESHLSGHRLIVGFEKLGDVQDAHEWVARQGRGDFTHPATGEPVGQVSDLFPSVRNKLHAKGFDSDAPLYTHPAPSVPAWAQDVVIEYRYTGGTHWCPLGPAERVKAGFDGVYRLKPGSFPTETPAPSAPDDVVRDAGRYRWLRNSLPAGQGSLTVILDDRCNGCFNKLVFMESLDVAIDAAMLAAAQAQKGGA